jgi:hypothetical protein
MAQKDVALQNRPLTRPQESSNITTNEKEIEWDWCDEHKEKKERKEKGSVYLVV